MTPARVPTIEEQLQHLASQLHELIEKGQQSGEHPAPPARGAWERWGRWVTVVSLIAGAAWWVVAETGFSRVTPREEISRLAARMDHAEAVLDTVVEDLRALKADSRFSHRIACRQVRDVDLVDQCARLGLRAQPSR